MALTAFHGIEKTRVINIYILFVMCKRHVGAFQCITALPWTKVFSPTEVGWGRLHPLPDPPGPTVFTGVNWTGMGRGGHGKFRFFFVE